MVITPWWLAAVQVTCSMLTEVTWDLLSIFITDMMLKSFVNNCFIYDYLGDRESKFRVMEQSWSDVSHYWWTHSLWSQNQCVCLRVCLLCYTRTRPKSSSVISFSHNNSTVIRTRRHLPVWDIISIFPPFIYSIICFINSWVSCCFYTFFTLLSNVWVLFQNCCSLKQLDTWTTCRAGTSSISRNPEADKQTNPWNLFHGKTTQR